MKILIAILSCRAHQAAQQAQRDTWVKDLPADVDLKYFVGCDVPDLASDEVPAGEDGIYPERGLQLYPTLPKKNRRVMTWALGMGYDYVFKTDTDTLVNVPNLLASGFEQHDYSGGRNWEEAGEFPSGGAGYWLSKKALSIVSNSNAQHWAEDVRTMLALREAGIHPVWNTGYRWQPGEVIDKDMITFHFTSCWRRTPYDPAWMYEQYRKMKAL